VRRVPGRRRIKVRNDRERRRDSAGDSAGSRVARVACIYTREKGAKGRERERERERERGTAGGVGRNEANTRVRTCGEISRSRAVTGVTRAGARVSRMQVTRDVRWRVQAPFKPGLELNLAIVRRRAGPTDEDRWNGVAGRWATFRSKFELVIEIGRTRDSASLLDHSTLFLFLPSHSFLTLAGSFSQGPHVREERSACEAACRTFSPNDLCLPFPRRRRTEEARFP